tara:strand:- start:916 stop:1107 length:192 start_codon:yes stop_codon:yes gene_type:complete
MESAYKDKSAQDYHIQVKNALHNVYTVSLEEADEGQEERKVANQDFKSKLEKSVKVQKNRYSS